MCRGKLNTDLMNKYAMNTISSPQVISNPDQCRMVYNAWTAMGGDPADFPDPPDQCCNTFGIECDDQGRITKLFWIYKGLYGNLYPRLGDLLELKGLYVNESHEY